MKKNYNSQKEEKLIISEKNKFHQINLSDITHIHSEGGISTIYKYNKDKFYISKNLTYFETELTKMYFVRANRNELINCASVIKFDHKNKKIELKNGICIKISRRKIKEIKEIFTNEKTVHINIWPLM